MTQTSPYTAQRPTKVRSMRFWALAIGMARPVRELIESRIVHTEIQNRSTDPKKSGARTNTTIVVQNWMDLNVTSQRPRLPSLLFVVRDVQFEPLTDWRATFTLVTVFAVLDTVVVVLLMSKSSL